MSVNLLTALGAVTPSTKLVPASARKDTDRKVGSLFGPAYELGGSKTNFATGLYNSLGTLLRARTTGATQVATPPEDKERSETLKAIAAKIDGGDIKGGRADALEFLKRRADDITVLRLIAHTYLAEKDYAEAERYYVRAVALAPDNTTLRDDVAIARVLQKGDGEVLAHARRLLDAPTQRNAGLRLLLRLTDRSPESAEAYLALADGYAAARKPPQVLIALNEAEQYADKDQIEEVITRAQKLAREHADIGLPHNILGRALTKAGRFNDAVKELKIAVDLKESSKYAGDLVDAYVARANDKLSRGDALGAASDLRAAAAIDQFNEGLAEATAQAAFYDARRDVMLGRYTGALNDLRTASLKGPDDVSFKKKVAALYTLVGAHFRDIDADSTALFAFSKAYELDPSSVTARHNVGTLAHKLGLEALSNKSYYAAVSYMEQAYETQRTNTTYQKDLALAYDARGQYRLKDEKTLAAGIEDLKRAYRLDPTNTSIEANLTAALS